MGDKLKSMTGLAFGLVILLGVLSLPFIFIKGAMWASEEALPTLVNVGWIVLAAVVLLLIPLSLLKRARGFTGVAIFITSYLFGLICWLTGFIVTYTLWGLWAVIIGLLFLGGGVVPLGVLASLFNGEWQSCGILIVLVILTFGTRLLGMYIIDHGE